MGGTVDFFKNLGNKDVTNPNEAEWKDLSGSEKGARVTAQTLGGFGRGLQQRSAAMQPQTAATPIQVTPTPELPNTYDPNYLARWRNGMNGGPGQNPNDPFGTAFYGR